MIDCACTKSPCWWCKIYTTFCQNIWIYKKKKFWELHMRYRKSKFMFLTPPAALFFFCRQPTIWRKKKCPVFTIVVEYVILQKFQFPISPSLLLRAILLTAKEYFYPRLINQNRFRNRYKMRYSASFFILKAWKA